MKKYSKPEFEKIEFTEEGVLNTSLYDNIKDDPGGWFNNSEPYFAR